MEVIVLSILGWGLSGALAGVISRRASIVSLMFWGPFISLPLVIVPVIFGASFQQPTEAFLFVGLSYLSLTLAWFFYWQALRIAETSLVIALGATYPLISLFLFLLFEDARWSFLLLGGCFLVSLGIFLLQIENRKSTKLPWRSLLFGLSSATLWGFWGFFDWQSLQYAKPWDIVLIFFLFSPIFPLFLGILSRFRKLDLTIDKETVWLRFLTSISSTVALISLYHALSKSPDPSVVIALAATYPLATLFFLALGRREKITLFKVVAISLTTSGVALLQIYTFS